MTSRQKVRDMSLYVGLDVGTTTLSVVILDAQTGQLAARYTLAHDAEATSHQDKARGRAELDLERLRAQVLRAISEAVAQAGACSSQVRGLGVTGQMHGLALLGPGNKPLGPAITWQDRRALDRLPGDGETYLQHFLALAGGPAAFERMGCLPAAGYLGVTLFWLKLNDQLPPPPATACFIPDVAVSFLTGRAPCTDPTDGGSSGIMDIVARDWDWPLIDRLGLPRGLFPPVLECGERAGELLPEVARETGLPRGLPVFVALGDNQASFLGSMRQPEFSLLINVGTGSQLSALAERFQRPPRLDVRYFPGGRYLLVGAGLFGGRSYSYLREFFRRVGSAFFEGRGDEELYDAMNRLAAAIPPGADGLRCVPLFTGTRTDPTMRGSFTGITPENLTPGHLTRALLEGMAEGFYAIYEAMRPLLGPRTHLVGSGNGLRRNRLLAEILASRFQMPLHLSALEEEAATGAVLLAAVGAGEFGSWEEEAVLMTRARVAKQHGILVVGREGIGPS
jgi:sugar (pentulose or hexulose) kinase